MRLQLEAMNLPVNLGCIDRPISSLLTDFGITSTTDWWKTSAKHVWFPTFRFNDPVPYAESIFRMWVKPGRSKFSINVLALPRTLAKHLCSANSFLSDVRMTFENCLDLYMTSKLYLYKYSLGKSLLLLPMGDHWKSTCMTLMVQNAVCKFLAWNASFARSCMAIILIGETFTCCHTWSVSHLIISGLWVALKTTARLFRPFLGSTSKRYIYIYTYQKTNSTNKVLSEYANVCILDFFLSEATGPFLLRNFFQTINSLIRHSSSPVGMKSCPPTHALDIMRYDFPLASF